MGLSIMIKGLKDCPLQDDCAAMILQNTWIQLMQRDMYILEAGIGTYTVFDTY